MNRRVNLTNTRFNEVGATPLLLAAVTADAEYMKALVALGADPKATNNDGSTASWRRQASGRVRRARMRAPKKK
jgi:ankyrin repeat protein